MPSQTANYAFDKPTVSGDKDTWGDFLNSNWDNIDTLLKALIGRVIVTHDDTANYVLTTTGYDAQAKHNIIEVQGTLTAARNIVVPTDQKAYLIYNNTTGGFAITVKTPTGTGVTINYGVKQLVYSNGTNVVSSRLATVDGSNVFNSPQTMDSLLLSGATGGNQGTGRINAQGIYVNGEHVDFKKGVFTPAIVGTTSIGAGTYSRQDGNFTKIGDTVFFQLYIIWTAHSGTGNMNIDGLPYVVDASYFGPCSLWDNGISLSAGHVLRAYVAQSDNEVKLSQVPTGGGNAVAVPMDTAGNLMISGHYKVAA